MTAPRSLRAILSAHLNDRASSWSIGGYGAIAEFHWLPDDDPAGAADTLQVVTRAGALQLQLREDIVPHAYLSLSQHPDRWLQGFALCLPWRRARRAARTVLTELGPDHDAMRKQDRRGVLFDLGLGLSHVEACVRSDSPALSKALRAGCGRSLLDAGNRLMDVIKKANPHRVFMSQLGRVEVYQAIAAAGQKPAAPLGPHTHVIPRLLLKQRPGADDDDAPAYHRACAYLYPRHPLMDSLGRRKPYDCDAHAHFTALMERWGGRSFMTERQRAMHAMRNREDASHYRAPADSRSRRALRIAIRELAQALGEDDVIDAWRRRFDRTTAPKHPHLVH